MMKTRTTCPYCGVGCGVVVSQTSDGAFSVAGDPAHPANFGRLCVKGASLGETLGLEGRLLEPEVDGRQTGWDSALDAAAQRLAAIIAQHGPNAVAFYASGQLLTEDYYAANKLMKGFIGSANIDTNSRLCMSSAVVGYKRAFGADVVPGNYQDIERSDMVVLVGSNAAWTHPVLYQRLAAAKAQRPEMKVVVIDPRRTATCDIADLHLALKPGTDAALFNGLLNRLASQLAPDTFDGQASALVAAREWTPEQSAAFCELSCDEVTRFYDGFIDADRVVTLYTMGINQSTSGSDKCNAIINVHLASGKYGREGCGPFSLTGQPNAMGGREVGGLANQLACHMGFDPQDIARLRRFWGSERIAETPGLMAVELFEAIHRGEVKAVWIMGTNPAVSLPDSDRVREALRRCPLVIVSEVSTHSDTLAFADIRFPAQAWGEKNGTVTNSERRISRQRSFMPAPGSARPDWWIIAQTASRLGFGEAFAWQHPSEVFSEHARLSGFENHGSRAFDISGLASLNTEQWDNLLPIQWPVTEDAPQGTPRLPATGRAWHPSGRPQLVAVTPQPTAAETDAHYPLLLNTGRIRDQWHTMTRTGLVPKLMQHQPLPWVRIHPDDAAHMGISEQSLVRLSSPRGWALGYASLSDEQRRGELFMPMHWNNHFASQSRINALVAPHVDPHSGQPESKQTAVRVQRVNAPWHGTLYSRHAPDIPPAIAWWRQATGWKLAATSCDVAWLETRAAREGWQLQYARGDSFVHLLAWQGAVLQLALYLSRHETALDESAILDGFTAPVSDPVQRHQLLAGGGASPVPAGRTVCSCMGVGEKAICAAIASGCDTPAALGKQLGCGTQCGSCVPELRALIAASLTKAAN
nr:nitrate reductase [Atlantibacter hermannii]